MKSTLFDINNLETPLNILIVDDDKANLAVIAKTLEINGFNSKGVTSGEAALEAIKGESFDVILLDIMMPGLDGFEVCRRIKNSEATRLIPIIVVTALTEKEDRVEGIEAGCDDFLSKPIDRMELIARIKSLGKMKRLNDDLESAEAVVISLAKAVDARDDDTGKHCDTLDRMAVEFGSYMNLSKTDILTIERVAALHDIGKIGIPDSILLKPGPLTEEEWKVMKKHTIVGEAICKPLRTLKNICPIIRSHHEKWNGSGYPDGIKGEAIPYLARVFQILDAYDAITRDRPYKKAAASSEALKILKDETEKGMWDPHLMAKFIEFLRKKA